MGASPSYAAFTIAKLLATSTEAAAIVLVPDEQSARRMVSDLRFFTPLYHTAGSTLPSQTIPGPVLPIPPTDLSRYADLAPDRSATMQRLSALYRLSANSPPPRAIVVSSQSLLQRVVPKSEFCSFTATITPGQKLPRDNFLRWLVKAGYRRAPLVQDPGTFAVRGGVIDIFCPLYTLPARIELLDDNIESLRLFDAVSQRTVREVDKYPIHPVRETIATHNADVREKLLSAADTVSHPSKATRALIHQMESGEDFFGLDALVPAFHQTMASLQDFFPVGDKILRVVYEPEVVEQTAREELDQADKNYQRRKSEHRLAFPPGDHYISLEQITSFTQFQSPGIVFRNFHTCDRSDPNTIEISIQQHTELKTQLERKRKSNADELLQPLLAALSKWTKEEWSVGIACPNVGRMQRVRGLLREHDIEVRTASPTQPLFVPGLLSVFSQPLSSGFVDATNKISLLTDAEIFGPRKNVSSRQHAARKRAHKALSGQLASFENLSVGDYIVHEKHGVGVYQGLAKLPMKNDAGEFLHIHYRDGTLYLPIYRIHEVRCYVGAQGHAPRVDRLGGSTWATKGKAVSRDVRALAEELLQLYAQRQALPGIAFPKPDAMFREFEATFAFDETPDQLRAIQDVLRDMESPSPMDRLVCGDVGYGKTEVAIRATLKAILGAKQVAILAPTTVLVEQHYQTFAQRFSGWPIRIAKLSRFQSKKQQAETIRELARGTIDAVIGTHRLLSKDIRFKDLGLLVVDEEQRFGVTHKERIKRARTQIDTLTLTATPIPRTLHLAMVGLRDLSIIATPPADRQAVRTFLSGTEDEIIAEGIRRELARNGQIFFVTPHIDGTRGEQTRSLEEWAKYLQTLVSQTSPVVVHSRLQTNKLEQTMVDFVSGKYNVLVSTTIIENGLDIPRANTMFIAHADYFGLSQLYQLRGRIGRSTEKAYCYLMVDNPNGLTKEARLRLETLRQFTELGSGFQIASHDLEIRGAGELFGARQSGSIAAVGFENYIVMLKEAVTELRGESITHHQDPEMHLTIPAFIPDDYIPDIGQRLGFYRQLSTAANQYEISTILDTLTDRYGVLPTEVTHLADVSNLRCLARQLNVQTLELSNTHLSLSFSLDSPIDVDTWRSKEGYRATSDRRLRRIFDTSAHTQPTEAAQACLLELLAYATNQPVAS